MHHYFVGQLSNTFSDATELTHLSKVFEYLVLVHLGQVMEHSVVLPTTQFAYQKDLGTCNPLLCMSHTLQSALESGQEVRIMKIDFSAAINHLAIHYKLCSVGNVGSVLLY